MPPNARDLWDRFRSRVPKPDRPTLETVLRTARAMGASAFLVGGSVRDLLLARPGLDIDIAVEGDIEAFASELAEATGRRVVQHGRFGTATLRGEEVTFDFARTRRESYPRPGALPEVEPAAIEDDLARRDFKVNAMAVRLTPPEGDLLDPYGGQQDLGRRLVRVLHARSFQDDATRMLRACRYAARLAFAIEAQTLSLLRRDLPYLDTISGPRLRREMGLGFREASAVPATEQAARLGILAAIDPLLALEPVLAVAWQEALNGERHANLEELGFCVVSRCASQADVAALSARLHLTGRLEGALADLVRLQDLRDKLDQPDVDAAMVVEVLERFAPSAVLAFALKTTGRSRERALEYLSEWRRVKVSLNGFDLQRLGVPRGPALGEALRRLRKARLLGEVTTKQEEVALIEREFVS